jgi:multidrug resistance efflux pump
LMLFLMLVIPAAPAFAQPALPDSQTAETLLTEIRALRSDLRNAAATVQRVQILVYRLQIQAIFLEKAQQRLDQARAQCKRAEDQQKFEAIQIEQMKKQSADHAAGQRDTEQRIPILQADMEAQSTFSR